MENDFNWENMEESNSSGHGISATLPGEIDRWNWGAFFLHWLWGIGNNTFIAFLMFIPFLNVIMMFVLGAKGSSWAWRNKKWESVEQFKAVQRKWAISGLIVHIVFIIFIISRCSVGPSSIQTPYSVNPPSPMFNFNQEGSDLLVKMAMTKIESDREVTLLLGKPLSTGMRMVNMQTINGSVIAQLTLSVQGPKSKGILYMDAVKKEEEWEISHLYLIEEGTGHRIDLNQSVI